MDDSISRQAAIDALDRIGSLDTEADKKYAISVFEELPSVQPEIIRCKDCENYQTDWQPLSFDDGHYCAMVDTIMPYDGFCHMGERRTDD